MEKDHKNEIEEHKSKKIIENLEIYKIKQVISIIPEIFKSSLELYFVHDMPMQDIADLFDLPEQTIESRIYHGVDILKDALDLDEIDERTKIKIISAWEEIEDNELSEIPKEEDLYKMGGFYEKKYGGIESYFDEPERKAIIIQGPWKELRKEDVPDIDIKKKKKCNKNTYNRLWDSRTRKFVTSVIIISCLSASVVTGYAMYKSKFIQKIINDYTEISLDPEIKNKSIGKVKIEEVLLPTYMVDGYVMSESEVSEDFAVTKYTNKNLQNLRLRQWPDNVVVNKNSENAIQEKVFVNGEEGLSIKAEGVSSLIWYQDGYCFRLDSIDANIELNDIIRIAESLEKQK